VKNAKDDINCIDCNVMGCDMCDNRDLTVCLLCSRGLYVHDGSCMPACPPNFMANSDGNACVPFKSTV